MFDTFKKWKSLVENETGQKLKFLKSDHGDEYYNKEFDSYCLYNGIHREKTFSGTPQENGLLERMNRTIMEDARSRRFHVGFPLHFWETSMDTIV